MTTIEHFVRARLDEQETLASIASPGPWVNHHGDVRENDTENWVANAGANDRAHIALYDPTHVLADVASTRLILAMWAGYRDRCASGRGYDTDEYTLSALDDVVAHLACRWSNHPDFDPSWRVA